MEDADFSDAFCRFIQNNIPSVEAAELLLALQREGGPLTPAQAVLRLGPNTVLGEAETARLLEAFHARGMVAKESDGFRYREGADQRHVETLGQAYQERPVTLVRIIYALRDTRIQSFAEAFRLRKR
ncbi:MAG: hypothetical protein ACT4P3_14200 [Betaproteobacteria bacterium]